MPRTFSRGRGFTADTLLTIIRDHLPDDEWQFFASIMKNLVCIEPGLIEQDLFGFFEFIIDRLFFLKPFLSIQALDEANEAIQVAMEMRARFQAEVQRLSGNIRPNV